MNYVENSKGLYGTTSNQRRADRAHCRRVKRHRVGALGAVAVLGYHGDWVRGLVQKIESMMGCQQFVAKSNEPETPHQTARSGEENGEMKVTYFLFGVILFVFLVYAAAAVPADQGTSTLAAHKGLAQGMTGVDVNNLLTMSIANMNEATAEATRKKAQDLTIVVMVGALAVVTVLGLVVVVSFRLLRPPWEH